MHFSLIVRHFSQFPLSKVHADCRIAIKTHWAAALVVLLLGISHHAKADEPPVFVWEFSGAISEQGLPREGPLYQETYPSKLGGAFTFSKTYRTQRNHSHSLYSGQFSVSGPVLKINERMDFAFTILADTVVDGDSFQSGMYTRVWVLADAVKDNPKIHIERNHVVEQINFSTFEPEHIWGFRDSQRKFSGLGANSLNSVPILDYGETMIIRERTIDYNGHQYVAVSLWPYVSDGAGSGFFIGYINGAVRAPTHTATALQKADTKVRIIIDKGQPPVVDFKADTGVCLGEPVSLNSLSYDPDNSGDAAHKGIVLDEWEITAPDGAITELEGENAAFTPTQAGKHTVKLTSTDDEGMDGEHSSTIKVQSEILIVKVDNADVDDVDTAGDNSFIVSNTIKVSAKICRMAAGVPVKWKVRGQGAASGIKGFPTEDVTVLTDDHGISTFAFTPSSVTQLVEDRKTKKTLGSTSANDPIALEFEARIEGGNEKDTITITQDVKDTLRQEYYDYQLAYPKLAVPMPWRREVVDTEDAHYNQGNYSVQILGRLVQKYEAIVNAYVGQQITVPVIYNGKQMSGTTVIPTDARVIINSAFRCPQRNRSPIVKSKHPDSAHVFGRALDIQPDNSLQLYVQLPNGQRQRVTLTKAQLFPFLMNAAQMAAEGRNPIYEKGNQGEDGTVTAKTADHIHVQWN